MTEHGLIIAGIAVLATGTYLLRLAGFRLGSRLTLSPGANAPFMRGADSRGMPVLSAWRSPHFLPGVKSR
jgi:hypothetical protein